VVAKRLTSPYQPGQRSRARIKTPIRRTAEVIIAGWAPATGNADVLGLLLLAAHTGDGELVYVGDGGTGFTDAARRHLLDVLRPLQRDGPQFGGEFVRLSGRRPHRPALKETSR
jgi:bifunctional non-homologous end joining protein LigD